METYAKSKRRKIVAICGITGVIICILLVFQGRSHSTYYRYDDTWVIGRHVTEIEERYGEFDYGEYKVENRGRVGYVVKEIFPIMSNPVPSYYYMEYDETGIVTEVYVALHPGG